MNFADKYIPWEEFMNTYKKIIQEYIKGPLESLTKSERERGNGY